MKKYFVLSLLFAGTFLWGAEQEIYYDNGVGKWAYYYSSC